jgi:hypothetical protein
MFVQAPINYPMPITLAEKSVDLIFVIDRTFYTDAIFGSVSNSNEFEQYRGCCR